MQDADGALVDSLGDAFRRPIAPAVRAGLLRFAQLLLTWNARINLTGATSVRALIEEHFPDSFALDRLVPPSARLLDVGSGGGLPAIPFALLRPDARLVLCEPRSRRRAFLTTALRELGLVAEVRSERAEKLVGGVFDAVAARAVLPPEEWLALGSRLVEPGGRVVLFLNEPAGTAAALLAGESLLAEVRYRAGDAGRRALALKPHVPRGTDGRAQRD